MQKIAIIGPGSFGIAAQMQLLAPQHEIVAFGFGDEIRVHMPERQEKVSQQVELKYAHSFDGLYKPTREEETWINNLIERDAAILSMDWARQTSPWEGVAEKIPYQARAPRHHAVSTKSQPTAKARKAARKRAKAGRKASR